MVRKIACWCVALAVGWAAVAPARAMNGLNTAAAIGDAAAIRDIKGMLDEGRDVNEKDPSVDGATALIIASFTGHLNVVQLLLDEGAEVDAKGNDGRAALFAAFQNGHLEVVQALLAKGADIDAQMNNGATALIVASQNGHLEVVQALLAKGADVNVKMSDGRTALILASYAGHLKVVQALLTKGADVNAKANNGWTALDAARSVRHDEHLETYWCKQAPNKCVTPSFASVWRD